MSKATFESTHSYWEFQRSVRSERRFIHTKRSRRFLRAVLNSAGSRVETLRAGKGFLWRAQLGAKSIDVPIQGTDDTVGAHYPHPVDRMKPEASKAPGGRASPQGIPYLYLATHRNTALAEMRPWKGGVLSVGQFKIVKDLTLINTTNDKEQFIYIKQPGPTKRANAVWADINRAFSAPTTAGDDSAAYIPTQILSELFRDAGFDGIAYRSAYGRGHNIVLFDINAAAQLNCFVVHVNDIRFKFEVDQQFWYKVPAAGTK